MRRRVRGDKIYYYYDAGGKPRKELALGSDYVLALQKWAELEHKPQAFQPTFNDAADLYMVDVLPFKSTRTQTDNLSELVTLREFFGDARLDEIEPVHIKQFMSWRIEKARKWLTERGKKVTKQSGNVRANRERALFSHVYNFARGKGLTSTTNPCQGIDGLAEDGRDVYVDDGTYRKVWENGSDALRDAMDLAYLTGQRPADTVSMSENDIRDGHIHVKQGKTSAKLRIAITGELQQVIERIRKRRSAMRSAHHNLVLNQYGHPVVGRTVSEWLRQAREAAGVDHDSFKFMDLRAKAGTDKEDSHGMAAAKDQLGHSSEKMTAHYVRHRLGKRVTPTK